MQLNDIQPIIDNATEIITDAIFAFAVFRAVSIGRHLMNRIYRSRAYLLAAVIVFSVVQSFVPDSWVVAGLPIFMVAYFALLFFVLVFIDTTILVVLDMDFFHRNTLRWRQARPVVYAVSLIDMAIILFVTYLSSLPSPPSSVNSSHDFFPVIGSFVAVFLYSAATLIIGARRTPDRPMRKFLMLAGLLVLSLLVSTLIFNYTYIFAVDLFDDFLGVAIAYVAYLMVMSLSPTGKVEKEIAA
jgi:hypothetical protein